MKESRAKKSRTPFKVQLKEKKKKKKKTSTETSIKIDKHTGALVSVYSFYDSAGCL